MTGMDSTTTAEAGPHRWRSRAASVVRQAPVTLSLIIAILTTGIIGGGLWSPTNERGWWESVAYGLPAFLEGRWWTPLTGTFFVAAPAVYIPTVLSFAGMAYLEWRRGWRTALAVFGGGQLFGIVASALFLAGASTLPWPWAIHLADSLDVGASAGTMACLAVCVGLFPSPWRQRGWLTVVAYVLIGLLFLGDLADLEHAFAVAFVLTLTRSFQIQHASVRERRLIAFMVSIALGFVQIISLVLPTDGPFGPTDAYDGAWLAIAVDAVVIAFVTNGLRLGRRWAWALTVCVASLNILVAILYSLLAGIDPVSNPIGWGAEAVSIERAVLWAAFLLYLVTTRSSFRSRRRRPLGGHAEEDRQPSAEDAQAVIRAHGGGSLSWMATWEGMEYFRAGSSLVPYQRHLGVAIVLGDPLGPVSDAKRAIEEFVHAAERDALVPCFFSASSHSREAVPAPWRGLVIADDTIVDLPGLEFVGKPWSHVRAALNRAERERVSFRMTTFTAEPWGVRQQLRAISESWVGEKDLPEMRFTLGTLHEAEDPAVRLALAVSEVGDVEGFLSWLPIYGPGATHRGWTLDLMRRREGGFGPVMEYLIGASARTFAEEGAQILSLSGAPLSHEASEEEGQIAHLLGRLSGALEPVYGFASLHRFKQKFNPRYEPIYLLYRDEGDLARIGPALVRAFLPDASLRQYTAAGIDLIRKD